MQIKSTYNNGVEKAFPTPNLPCTHIFDAIRYGLALKIDRSLGNQNLRENTEFTTNLKIKLHFETCPFPESIKQQLTIK